MTRVGGQLLDETIHSHSLARWMRLHVYLPPHYGDYRMEYPVAILLHPWGADERFWTDHLSVHDVADRLIHAGAIPPFVGVMPQGDKSFFINAADQGGDFSPIVGLDPDTFEGALEGYGDYGDYVLHDVIPSVERTYRVRADRSARVIAGIGMGGAGAAALAFSHPYHFGAAGIHSPKLWADSRGAPPWIFGLGDPAAFAARSPVHLAHTMHRRSGLRIYLDCGYDDDSADSVVDLHHTMLERGIQHSYVSGPGGSDEDYWLTHLAEYLGFYAAGW